MPITLTCKHCNEPFTVSYKYRDRLFCKRDCYTASRHKSDLPVKITKPCDTCGKDVTYYPEKKQGYLHAYCCRECADLAKRTRFEIECRWCGKMFTVTPTEYKNKRRLCSRACRLAEQEDAKNRICEVCKTPFCTLHPSSPKRYCSPKCQALARKRREERPCDICGKIMSIMPCQKSHKRYCSRACQSVAKSRQKGPLAANWQGGLSFLPYGPEWTPELREAIKQRDGYKCQECGSTDHLSCHHIDYDKINCHASNLITLCLSCNSRANTNRKSWEMKYSATVSTYATSN